MIISFSELFKWQTCPRQYYYRYVLGKAPIEESDAMRTGTKGHRLLQSFYELTREGVSKEVALAKVTQSAMGLLNKEGVTDYSLLKAWTLVDNYIRDNDFHSDFELIENRFIIPVDRLIPSWDAEERGLADVSIGFTPDLVTRRKGDFVDVEDAKFVERAWSQSKLDRFPQIKLYQIFLAAMGYKSSRGVIRFFNVKTGKINTKPYVLDPSEVPILTHDFLSGVSDVAAVRRKSLEEKEKLPRTMNYTACQFCKFEYVCTLQAHGKDASKSLENMYKDSDYDYTR